jgi:peptide methionine sulfoxide reductase msrA/msrB
MYTDYIGNIDIKGGTMRAGAKITILCLAVLLGFAGWKGLNALLYNTQALPETSPRGEQVMTDKTQKSDKEWKRKLSEEQYWVLRQCGTERPFSGKYNDHWEEGVYVCAACGTPLFKSETKYEHGTGWPSFTAPVEEKNIEYREDYSLLTKRIEVRCAVCGGHLGHVFDDGPAPSFLHFCINSASLDFLPEGAAADGPQEGNGTAGVVPKADGEAEKLIKTEEATFAAGCFWGVEYKFGQVPGVLATTVGYAGGETKNPTYSQVCSSATGHAESVQVTFDPSVVSYEELVRYFFEIHDPTQVDRQGPDVGTQYRSAIFYHSDEQRDVARRVMGELGASKKFKKPIATELLPEPAFYKAEEYHQKYYQKNKIIRD